MRMLITATFPNEPFGELTRTGEIGPLMGRLLEATKPESIYFTGQQGCRGAVFVVNITDASEIPAIAEPWFLSLDAELDFNIAMVPEDLMKADLGALGKAWG